jgi:hypothetical protein
VRKEAGQKMHRRNTALLAVCEVETANSYMISSRVAGSPRAAGIVSSSADLAPHLGQKVEITGTMIPSKEAEADPNVPRAARYMKVTAIKKIADACP